MREAREETGFDIVVDYEIDACINVNRHDIHTFAAHIVGGNLGFPEGEILAAGWFTKREIDHLDEQGKLRSPHVLLVVNEYLKKSRNILT